MYPPTRALLVPLLLALAISLAPSVSTNVPASAATPSGEYAQAAFKTTNKIRVSRDRPRLASDRCLRLAAVRQAEKMAGQETIFHQLLVPLLDGCLLARVGENVAYGYVTGKAVVWKGWMKSPGHRRNILRRGWSEMGVAARQSDDGVWYVAQVFGTPTS